MKIAIEEERLYKLITRAVMEAMEKYDFVMPTDDDIEAREKALEELRKGKAIEILSNFDYKLLYISEWWKQLTAESEGKDGKGIFPASMDFTTDLHSMGQLVQEGERNLFETFLTVETERQDCVVPEDKTNLDNLNYLAGKKIDFINKKAYEATAIAHFEGGVPNSTLIIPEHSAFHIGGLFYFFEKAIALSGYLAGVNPFNQPGVEAYKKKMFKLLGKPEA